MTTEDELWFGQLFKNKKEITLAEYKAALELVPDSESYLAVPNTAFTITPDDTLTSWIFIKRPGLTSYESMKGLESAVACIHALELGQNDINPSNIMVNAEGMPMLIDFGSCQPFGGSLGSLGSPGWYEEFFRSRAKHDLFALGKLKGWLERPE